MSDKSFLRQILQMESLRQSGMVTVLSGINAVLSASAFLLLARNVGVEEFGRFSVWLAAMLLATKISDLGINLVIQRRLAQAPTLTKSTISWLRTSLYLKFVICGLAFATGLILLISTEGYHQWSLALLFLGITALNDFFVVLYQGFSKFAIAAFLPVLISLVKLIGIYWLFVTDSVGAMEAFVLWGFAPMVVVVIGMWWFWKTIGLGMPSYWKHDLVTLRAVGVWTSIGLLSAAVADQGDVLLVNAFLSDNATGLYNAAQKISSLFMMVTLSLSTVLSVRVARYSDLEMSEFLRKGFVMAAISILGVCLIVPFSKVIIYYLLGDDFTGSTWTFVWLLLSNGMVLATVPFAAAFYRIERPAYYMWSGLLLIVLLLFFDFLLIPNWGIAGAAMAKLITRIALLIFTLGYLRVSLKK